MVIQLLTLFKIKDIKFVAFFNNYSNESECNAEFKEMREKQAILCKRRKC